MRPVPRKCGACRMIAGCDGNFGPSIRALNPWHSHLPSSCVLSRFSVPTAARHGSRNTSHHTRAHSEDEAYLAGVLDRAVERDVHEDARAQVHAEARRCDALVAGCEEKREGPLVRGPYYSSTRLTAESVFNDSPLFAEERFENLRALQAKKAMMHTQLLPASSALTDHSIG